MTLGELAVDSFFIISRFLISASLMHIPSTTRFMWHRFLRILPGFWACLVVTAFLFAPTFWIISHGTIDGFLHPSGGSPAGYVIRNSLLVIQQENIGGLFAGSPYRYAINGSLWPLATNSRAISRWQSSVC